MFVSTFLVICHFTGGWLTVNVIAALPDTGDRSYDLYVKFIVYYPKYITQYSTKIIEKSAGWTLIREMFRFDKAPKDTPIVLQIWDHNRFKSDERLYVEKTTLSSMVDRVIFENSTMKSNSKLFMVSIWRDNIDYDLWTKWLKLQEQLKRDGFLD